MEPTLEISGRALEAHSAPTREPDEHTDANPTLQEEISLSPPGTRAIVGTLAWLSTLHNHLHALRRGAFRGLQERAPALASPLPRRNHLSCLWRMENAIVLRAASTSFLRLRPLEPAFAKSASMSSPW